MTDYEVFIGPFSAHAYTVYEVFHLIEVAVRLGFLSEEEASEACRMASEVITTNSFMKQWNKFSIYDRAKQSWMEDKAPKKSE